MKEPHHPQTYGPRWPRDRWISPTALTTYRNCAYRVRLAHIDRVPEPLGYHVFLRKGRITHNILRDIAHLLKRQYPVIDEDEILKRARLRLPPQAFRPRRSGSSMRRRSSVGCSTARATSRAFPTRPGC